MATGERGDFYIAADLNLLARTGPSEQPEPRGNCSFVDLTLSDQRFVLAMAAHRLAELHGIVHDASHHARRLHAAAVIGEHDGAMGDHVPHLGKSLALFAGRAGA